MTLSPSLLAEIRAVLERAAEWAAAHAYVQGIEVLRDDLAQALPRLRAAEAQAGAVRVTAGDYTYDGWQVAEFPKRSGQVRAVVEDTNGRLFIHRSDQIAAAPPPASGESAGETCPECTEKKGIWRHCPKCNGTGRIPAPAQSEPAGEAERLREALCAFIEADELAGRDYPAGLDARRAALKQARALASKAEQPAPEPYQAAPDTSHIIPRDPEPAGEVTVKIPVGDVLDQISTAGIREELRFRDEMAAPESAHSEDAALLPCPFCGATPEIFSFQDYGFDRRSVHCSCGISTFHVHAKQLEEVIRAWNTRALSRPEPVSDDEVERDILEKFSKWRQTSAPMEPTWHQIFSAGHHAASRPAGTDEAAVREAVTQIEGYLTEPTASAKVGRGHLRAWLYTLRALLPKQEAGG